MERPFKAYDVYAYEKHCKFICASCGRKWGAWYLDGYPRQVAEQEGRICPAGHAQTAEVHWQEAGETDIPKLLTER